MIVDLNDSGVNVGGRLRKIRRDLTISITHAALGLESTYMSIGCMDVLRHVLINKDGRLSGLESKITSQPPLSHDQRFLEHAASLVARQSVIPIIAYRRNHDFPDCHPRQNPDNER